MIKSNETHSKYLTFADLIEPSDIGIIGYGIVGQATANGFSVSSGGTDRIWFYDKYKDSSSIEEVVENSEYIFICLPTPMKKDESGIDLSILEENIERVAELTAGTDKIIIVKSTVVPGSTVRWEKKYKKSLFAFNPEFLTEANYLEDYLNADRTIIGANNDLIKRRLAVLYKSRFPNTHVFLTDPTTAEIVKYAGNIFLAMKVSLMNTFYDVCHELDVNYDEMIEMVTADKRISGSHSKVTSARGFGGKCFPKDTVAFIGLARQLGVNTSLLESMWSYNKKIRPVHDWEEIPFAVEGNHHKKTAR